jgi:hypothetical protein
MSETHGRPNTHISVVSSLRKICRRIKKIHVEFQFGP